MSTGNGHLADHPLLPDAAAQTDLLQAVLAELRTQMSVVVSDGQRQEITLDDHPVAGSKRVVAYRTGYGYDGISIPTTGQLLVPYNEGRIGSQWVNTGANACLLYLSDQARKGVPAVWLAAGGGSWDGRFGSYLWCGNIFAVAITGATTIVGGEF